MVLKTMPSEFALLSCTHRPIIASSQLQLRYSTRLSVRIPTCTPSSTSRLTQPESRSEPVYQALAGNTVLLLEESLDSSVLGEFLDRILVSLFQSSSDDDGSQACACSYLLMHVLLTELLIAVLFAARTSEFNCLDALLVDWFQVPEERVGRTVHAQIAHIKLEGENVGFFMQLAANITQVE